MVGMSSDNSIKIAHRILVCFCTYLWPVMTAVKASMHSKCITMCWKERAQGALCWDDGLAQPMALQQRLCPARSPHRGYNRRH